METLEKLEVARNILGEITKSDLRTNVLWLTHLRYCVGNLDLAMRFLEKEAKENAKTKVQS